MLNIKILANSIISKIRGSTNMIQTHTTIANEIEFHILNYGQLNNVFYNGLVASGTTTIPDPLNGYFNFRIANLKINPNALINSVLNKTDTNLLDVWLNSIFQEIESTFEISGSDITSTITLLSPIKIISINKIGNFTSSQFENNMEQIVSIIVNSIKNATLTSSVNAKSISPTYISGIALVTTTIS
jgi:hypothetical protein